jgi:myo-inositol-1-phosphate synthase
LRSCCKRGIHNTLVVILGEGREEKETKELRRSWDIEEQIKEFSSKLRVRIIEPNWYHDWLSDKKIVVICILTKTLHKYDNMGEYYFKYNSKCKSWRRCL